MGKRESELDPIDRAKSMLHLLRRAGKWCGFLSQGGALFCCILSYFKIRMLIENGGRIG